MGLNWREKWMKSLLSSNNTIPRICASIVLFTVGIFLLFFLHPSYALASSLLTDANHRDLMIPADPQLPSLNWQKRAEWVSVKTDVSPPAVGDGVHDDTASLQAALDSLRNTPNGLRCVFLPAGTYRITSTLTLAQIYGALLIGQGQLTRIVWDGPSGGVMYHSNGASVTRYIGIIWDGSGKAAVGIDHDSKTLYETQIRHQDEAFVNFTEAGIRIGHDQKIPTAEVMYRHCLFQNCGSGLSILEYNDYNNDLDGCLFRGCGRGIYCVRGNVYVRDCNFEKNTITDIYLASGSHSVRRCTSIRSRQFLSTGLAGDTLELMVQDCRVDGWTGNLGAISLGMRGPSIIFDCVFSHAPDKAPPIRLTNYAMVLQMLAVSNNSSPNSSNIVDKGANADIMEIPPGKRSGSLPGVSAQFFQESHPIPGKVYDARADFGAKGDGVTDDTRAVLATVKAARQAGKGAIAYIPTGIYNVSRTIPVTGSDYTIGGSGYASIINWKGDSNGVVFAVRDPQDVTLEQLKINAADDSVARVQQTSGGGKSTVTYDGIHVESWKLSQDDQVGRNGHIFSTREVRALECLNLPAGATVHIQFFNGTTRYINCGAATILGDFVEDGVVRVNGMASDTGFLGIQTNIFSGNPCDVVVENSQSLVVGDSYAEQTQRHLRLAGDANSIKLPGHVTMRGVTVQTYDNTPISIENYYGRFTYCGAHFLYKAVTFDQRGQNPVQIALIGNTFWKYDPTLHLDSGASLTMLQNAVSFQDVQDPLQIVPKKIDRQSNQINTISPEMPGVADALDDFRELGAMDMKINYPDLK